jgi:cytochrome c-type biogenesis protein CcmH/NrfG
MQKEGYAPVRTHVKGVPRFLRKIVRACLRANPKRRTISAAQIRRRLEAELGRPSTVDLRRELAGWLWEHQVFECRDNETVVRTGEAGQKSSPRWKRTSRIAAMAAIVATAVIASFVATIDLKPSASWSGLQQHSGFEALRQFARTNLPASLEANLTASDSR